MLREWVKAELSRYDDRPVVVWYDAGGTLRPLVDETLLPPRRLVVFDGSYLVLRFVVESEDPSFGQKWLVYIPEAAPAPSWLRDWELFGVRLELDLLELLRQAAGLSVDQELRDLLRGPRATNARILAASWESAVGNRPVSKEILLRALLAVVLGQPGFDLRGAVLRFLNDDNAADCLENAGLYVFWRRLLQEELGLSDLPEETEQLQKRLAAAVLLTELVEKSGQLADHFAALLPDPARRLLVLDIAEGWRENSAWQERYKEFAATVEREYRIGERLNVNERLIAVPTFLVIDELFLGEAEAFAGVAGVGFADHREKLARMAEERMKLFWARVGMAPYWEVLDIATKLHAGCQEALGTLGQARQVGELVAAYTAEEGWWRFDGWALRLAALCGRLSAERQERFLIPALRIYLEYVDAAARRLVEAAGRDGWQPDQARFWSETVKAGPGCTAVFHIDALRFDLARHLAKALQGVGEFAVRVGWRKAMLPSITEVGMAALLPEAEGGISLAFEDDRIKINVRGEDVTGRHRRRSYLARVLGRNARLLDLEEAERLGELPRGVEVLVILWDGIDDFGTFTGDLSPDTFFALVHRVGEAVRHLGRLGCARIVLTTDHGFLFVPLLAGSATRIPAPTGEQVVSKHRFAAGYFSGTPGTWEVEAGRIGWEGETLFAFPVGFGVFGLPGQTPIFLHGGLSLQEAVVPVVIVEPTVTARVDARMVLPDRISSATVRVRIVAAPRTLLDLPRRVRVEVSGPGVHETSEEVIVGVQVPEASLSLTWMSGLALAGPSPETLTFRLIDADTQEIVQQSDVPVSMLFA